MIRSAFDAVEKVTRDALRELLAISHGLSLQKTRRSAQRSRPRYGSSFA